MTEPISWELLRAVSSKGFVSDNRSDLRVVDGINQPYSSTEFGVLETSLQQIVWNMEENADPSIGDISPLPRPL